MKQSSRFFPPCHKLFLQMLRFFLGLPFLSSCLIYLAIELEHHQSTKAWHHFFFEQLLAIESSDGIVLYHDNAMKVEYAYAIDPIGVQAGVVSVPKIVRALDVIVPKAQKAFIITFAAEEREYDRYLPAFHTILKSVRLQ